MKTIVRGEPSRAARGSPALTPPRPVAPWPQPGAASIDGNRPTVDIPVGLGEVKIADRASEVLVAHGVGSCIIVCAWDPIEQVGGMAHAVLPESPAGAAGDGRYADAAVPLLLAQLTARGARPERLVVKLVGGAWLFGPKVEGETIGARNARATRAALAKHRLSPAAMDVGGRHGRTVRFDVTTGCVFVRTLGHNRVIL